MRNIVLATGFLLLASCTGKNNAPGYIIQIDTMKNVMWDMIQADQYAKLYLAKDSAKINVKQGTIRLYEQVFQIHHITKEEFTRSYRYYLAHQDLNKIIYDSLSLQLTRMRHTPLPIFKPPSKSLLKPVK